MGGWGGGGARSVERLADAVPTVRCGRRLGSSRQGGSDFSRLAGPVSAVIQYINHLPRPDMKADAIAVTLPKGAIKKVARVVGLSREEILRAANWLMSPPGSVAKRATASSA